MPGPTTDQRLIAAAERLFAEQGVGAVSLRAVMQAAQANVASVHYHFGSKRGLVVALLEDRLLRDWETGGRQRFDTLDAQQLYAKFLNENLERLLEIGDRGTYLDREELRRFFELTQNDWMYNRLLGTRPMRRVAEWVYFHAKGGDSAWQDSKEGA